jgi:hypothetical protein
MNNNGNDDQGLTHWGFTDDFCLKFYDSRARGKNSGGKIATVKAALRPYVGTRLEDFFSASNLTSILADAGDNLAVRLKLLLPLVDHLIHIERPLTGDNVANILRDQEITLRTWSPACRC